MTAPTPSPEEFANQMAATRLEAPHFICPDCGPGGCADEDGCCTACGATTCMSDAEWVVKRDAELTAPLRAEVDDARGALDDASAHEDNDTASVADRIATLAEERDFFRSAWFAVLDALYPHRLPDDQFDPKEVAQEIDAIATEAESLRAEVERLTTALEEAKNWLMSVAICDQDHRPLNERLAREFDWRRRSMTQESIARRGHEAAARALAPAADGGMPQDAPREP